MSVLDMVMQQLDGATIQKMAGQLGASPQQTQTAIAAALPLLIGAMQRNAAQPEGAASLHHAVVRDHQNVDLGGLLGSILGGGGSGGAGEGLMGVLGSVLGGGNQEPEQARRAHPQQPQQPQQPQDSDGGLMDVLGSVLGGGARGPASTRQAPQQQDEGGLMGVLGSVLGGGQSQSGGGLGMGEAILRHVLGGSQSRAATGVSKASGLDLSAVMKLLPMLAPLIMAALGRMTQQRQLDAGGLQQALGGEMQRFGGGQSKPPNFVNSILDVDGDGDVDASDLMARASQVFGAFGR
jgi:hypothetical protein